MHSQEINLMVLYEKHKDLIWELERRKEIQAATRPQSIPLAHTLLNSIGNYMVSWGSKLQRYGSTRRTIAVARR